MKLLSVVPLLTCALAAQDLTTLRSFYGYGGPSALTVDAAETLAYVGENASVSIVDLTTPGLPLPPSAVLARFPVDAAIIALTLDEPNQRLFVAGGSFGLLSVDLASPTYPVTSIEDLGDLVCFEAALTANHVVAIFGADGASQLRVYDRSTLALVGSTALGTGTAFALAMNGSYAYVAMGTGGLSRVDLGNPAAPVAVAGPTFPIGVFGDPGRARDIDVENGRIYAAVDDLGLVSARTSLPWGPTMAYSSIALSGAAGTGTGTLYAHRVDAVGTTIYVGANDRAGREADGGPFTSFGPMDYKLSVGGVVTPGPMPDSSALTVFQLGTGGLAQVQQVDVVGGWRELVARGSKVYDTHAFSGTFVRDTAALATPSSSYHGSVYAPAEALLSLRDPNIVISGQDGAGQWFAGLLDIDDPDAITPIPGTGAFGSFGLWFDAQWLDGNPTREWFIGNGTDDWRLYRFDAAAPAGTLSWGVKSPDDPLPGQNNGRNYWLSWLDGDLLLLTRGGTRYGLVGYSKSAIEAQAGLQVPGTMLSTPHLWQLETHFAGELDQAQTWRCRTFSLAGGQRIAAIAAGFHTTPGANDGRPQVVLYDISSGTSGVPTLLSTILGPNIGGNAVAAVPVRRGGVTYLFVADFGYGLHVYDVSVPTAPVLVGGWQAPANVFDGIVDHATDIEIEATPSGGLTAYVALWRRGLVALDVSNPASFGFPLLDEVDTPGLPYGIAIRDVDGSRGLVLADHQAGLRLYGHYAEWQSLGGGCSAPGSAPVLSVTSAPVIGGTFSLAVDGLGSGAAQMVLGFAPANIPLAPLGLGFGPGCTLLVSPDSQTPLAVSGGSATWSAAIPNDPLLRGVALYNQVLELNTASTASNAGVGIVD